MIPSGPYSLASCHSVLKLVRSFGTITAPLLDSSSAASDTTRMKHLWPNRLLSGRSGFVELSFQVFVVEILPLLRSGSRPE